MTYCVNDQATLVAALAGSESNIDIIVTASFTMTASATIPAGKAVSMTSFPGRQYTITRGSGAGGNLFTIPSGGSLRISDLIIDGSAGAVSSDTLILSQNGTLRLDRCAVLQNNVNSVGKGGGIRLVGGTLNINGGTIRNSTASNGGGIYNEDANSTICIRHATITGNSATNNGGGIYLNAIGNKMTIECSSQITNNTAAVDGGGIWVARENLAKLDICSSVVFLGNSAKKGYNRATDDDATYKAHVFSNRWSTPFDQGYNNYDISYTNGAVFIFPASVTLQASKSAQNTILPERCFQFGVYDTSGTLLSTATNGAGGVISFPPLILASAGSHSFNVREISASGKCWTADTRVFPVTITVSDDGSGRLTADVQYPQGTPSFTNTFNAPTTSTGTATGTAANTPASTSVSIQIRLRTCDLCLCGGEFTFSLKDDSGKELAQASNDKAGSVTFPNLAFTQASVMRYSIFQINPSCSECVSTTPLYKVTVNITSGCSGLVARASYARCRK